MTPAQLRKLAADPRFIAGIYNYCDRWCERCPLSHRCLSYAMERAEDDGDPAARDLANKTFWNKLHAGFQLTMQMLHEDAQRLGIDLNASEARAEIVAHERQIRRRAARNRPLSRAARDYGLAVQKWFKDSPSFFKARAAELVREVRLQIGRPLDEAVEIRELLDIVRWYRLFIHVKLHRAIGSQAEEETDPELRDMLRDADGSAKVALIGIDRSLAAWAALRLHFPDQEDAILDFLLRLARIRRQVEKLFPNARAFVRPGFDENAARLEVGG